MFLLSFPSCYGFMCFYVPWQGTEGQNHLQHEVKNVWNAGAYMLLHSKPIISSLGHTRAVSLSVLKKAPFPPFLVARSKYKRIQETAENCCQTIANDDGLWDYQDGLTRQVSR